jgi:phthalate 4,5-dioxygenase
MLTREENELLVRTGPGTPMGEVMRRYWMPVVFSNQLPKPDCPPLRVKIMNEKLVVFRTTDGRVGLVDERCPHRGASVFFGRNEENGLRCVYHGWKFDVDGRCVDMPSEPAESNFRNKVKITAYPCVERAGIVWTYMGPPQHKPGFPELEWTRVPDSYRYVTRHMQECNWLQGVEGGFDMTHVAFLHRRPGLDRGIPERYTPLEYEGGMLYANGRSHVDGRAAREGTLDWSVECMILPFHKLITFQPNRPYGAHMWVPMDDETCMNWSIEYQPHQPLTDEELDRSYAYEYIHTRNMPGSDRMLQNADNDYLIDREAQSAGKSFTGIPCFGVQDAGIQESMGRIADRTRERLGTSDLGIILLRKIMLGAIKSLTNGGRIPASNPADYNRRVAQFSHPKGAPVEEVIRQSVIPDAAMAK